MDIEVLPYGFKKHSDEIQDKLLKELYEKYNVPVIIKKQIKDELLRMRINKYLTITNKPNIIKAKREYKKSVLPLIIDEEDEDEDESEI